MTGLFYALASVVVNGLATYVIANQLNQANHRFLFKSDPSAEQPARTLGLKIQTLLYLIASGVTFLTLLLGSRPIALSTSITLSEGVARIFASLGLLLFVLGIIHFAVLTIVVSLRSQEPSQSLVEQFDSAE